MKNRAPSLKRGARKLRSAASICKYPGMFQLFEKNITLIFKLYQHLFKPTLNRVIFP